MKLTMLKNSGKILLTFAVLAFFTTACRALTFAVVGSIGEESCSKEVSRSVKKEILLMSPDFLILTGGFMSQSKTGLSEDFSRKMLQEYTRYGIPIHAVPGPDDIGTESHRNEFERCFGKGSRSFRVDSTAFIVFNTARPGVEKAVVEMEDYLWLVNEFERYRELKNCVLIIHFPLLGTKNGEGQEYWKDDKWYKRVMELTQQVTNLKLVIQGHERLYRESVRAGVNFITSACSGGSPAVSVREGGFPHYLMFHVEDDRISHQVYTPFSIDYEVFPENTGDKRKVKVIVRNFLCRELFETPLNGIRVLMPAAESYRITTSNPTVRIRSVIPEPGNRKTVVLSMRFEAREGAQNNFEEILLEVVR